jgi:hypothetical protein
MEKKLEITNPQPIISLNANGNLLIRGTDNLEILARTNASEGLILEQQGENYVIQCLNDLEVCVPSQVIVEVQAVHGNSLLKALEGKVTVIEAYGNLSLRNTGPAVVMRVHGELSARHIKGELRLGTADGNVNVRDISGCFVVEDTVRGNLYLSDMKDSSQGSASGNISLQLQPAPGQNFTFSSQGNLLCRLARNAGVKVKAAAKGKLMVKVGDVTKNDSDKDFEFNIGDGRASLDLSAKGNLIINDRAADFGLGEDFEVDFDRELGPDFEVNVDEIGQQVVQQIDAQLKMIERQLETQMESLNTAIGVAGISPEYAERINRRAREAAARAAGRAQEKMARAREKLQRKIEIAQHKAEQQSRNAERRARFRERRSWDFEWHPTPTQETAEPVGESVSDDERLMILRMLEQKKITPEEAEKLLTALEGVG